MQEQRSIFQITTNLRGPLEGLLLPPFADPARIKQRTLHEAVLVHLRGSLDTAVSILGAYVVVFGEGG